MKRRILIVAFAVVVLLAAVVAGGLFYLDSTAGRAWLARTIEDAVSEPGVMELKLGEIAPGLPGRISIESASLADRDGIWLEMEKLTLRWDPWSLLSRRLDVEFAEFASVAIFRAPLAGSSAEPADPGAAEDFAMPELPLDIVVAELVVAQLALGEPLLGTAAVLDIGAELSATRGGRIQLGLDIERIDGVGGSLHAEADIDLSEGKLSLAADAHEPAGGVVVHLLDLAPYPEFHLSLQGEGPATAWSGSLVTSAGDLAMIDVDANVAAGDTLEIVVGGTAAVIALLPEALKDVVGPEVGLNAELEIDGERFRVTRLDTEAKAFAMTAQGEVEIGANTIDMTVDLTGRDPAPLEALAAPLELSSWRLKVSAVGDLDAPDLDIDGDAQAVAMQDLFSGDIKLAAGVVPGSSGGWHAEGHVAAAGANTSIDAAQGLLGGDPLIEFAVDTDAAFARFSGLLLSVTGANLELTAQGDLDLDDFSGQATIDATISDVAVLSDEIGLAVSGGLGLQTNLVLDPDIARASGSLSLIGDGFAVDDAAIAPFVGQELIVTSDIDTDLATTLSLAGLAIRTEAVDLAGTLDLTDGFSQFDGRLDGPLEVTAAVADMAGLDPGGNVDLSLRFAGAVDDPVIRARAKLNGVAVADTSLDGVTVNAEARDLAATPHGEALVSLASSVGAIKIAASFAIEGDDIVLPAVAIAGAGVDGAGAMRLAGNGLVSGELGGSVVDIMPLVGIVDIEASGSAVFRVTLAPDDAGGQGANIALQATDLSMLAGEDDLVAARELRLAAQLSDLAGEPAGAVDLSVGAATYQSYTLDGTVIHAVMADDLVTIDLGAQGDVGVPVVVDIGVEVDLSSEDTTLTFNRLEGSVSNEPFAQQEIVRVVLGGESLTVDNLVLEFAGGTFSADLMRAPDALDANVVIDGLPLDVVEVFVPDAAVTGVINAEVNLTTSRGVVVGSVDLTASGIDLSEGLGDESAPADIELTARLGEASTDVEIAVGGLPGTQFDGHIKLGAAIDASSLSIDSAQAVPLDASLNLTARLETIWDDLPASDQRMRGDLKVELSATGVVGDPKITGQASLVGGRYEHLVYGTLIDDIALSMTGDSTRNLAIQLSANDGDTGTIRVDGQVSLGDGAQVEATLSFQDATLVRRDDVTASASGDIQYAGNLLGGAIVGQVTTNVVEISLDNSLPPSVVVLNVHDVFDVRGNGQQSGGAAIWSSTLDLAIEMPRRIFVRGKGIDTEWFGHIDIGGTTDKPIIEGKLEIQRGQVSLVGRVFEMTTGSVEMDPEELDNPIINMVAESQRQDVTGIITISGRANDPTIEITSTPSLPQAEVLPRVLFGKSASNLSAFEAFELASAVAELSGVGGGGPGIIDRARQTLGVDVLRVGSDDEGATTVGAGSYLTERVYVGVEQGTGAQSSTVKVEVEVTDDITVDTSTGADASANVGVNWRWDY